MRSGTSQGLWVHNQLLKTVFGNIHSCETDMLVAITSLVTSTLKPEASLMASPGEAVKELPDQVVCMSTVVGIEHECMTP